MAYLILCKFLLAFTRLLRGDADATVDWRYNVGVIRQLFPASHVEYLSGAGHQLANESDTIRSDYLRLVETWLTESGIGQDNSAKIADRSNVEPG